MSGSNSDVSSQGDSDNSFDEYMRGIGTAVAAAVRELRTNPPEKRKRQNDRFERVVKQVRRRAPRAGLELPLIVHNPADSPTTRKRLFASSHTVGCMTRTQVTSRDKGQS